MKEYKYKINGNEYNVAVEELEGNKANVTVNGKSYQVELDRPAKPAVSKPVVARPAAAPAAAPALYFSSLLSIAMHSLHLP